jgi:hypothetical protein
MSEIERLTRSASVRMEGTTYTTIKPRTTALIQEVINRLAEYETQEEQGILIRFPCKVGDTVYVLTSDSPSGIEKTTVSKIRLTRNSYRVICKCVYDDWGDARWEFTPNDFEKRYFLTEESAKKALHHG